MPNDADDDLYGPPRLIAPRLRPDPELERLIAEEEEIERQTRQNFPPTTPRKGLTPTELHALAQYLEDIRSLPSPGPFRAKEMDFTMSDGRRLVVVWDEDDFVLRHIDFR